MSDFKIRRINSVPQVAEIVGTDQTYGLERKFIGKTPLPGGWYSFMLRDGVFHVKESDGKQYFLVVSGDTTRKHDYPKIGEVMSDFTCEREDAWRYVYEELMSSLRDLRGGYTQAAPEFDDDEIYGRIENL